MRFSELLTWAWTETPPVHKNRANLVIHILAVPMFVVGHALLLAALIRTSWLAVAGAVAIVASLAAQGFGHSLEQQQVPAFSSRRDFIRRLYAEQFCNFWRFIFSGGWYASLKAK